MKNNFDVCIKVKSYIENIQKEVDVTTIPRIKLLGKLRKDLGIKVGLNLLVQVLEHLGIKHERHCIQIKNKAISLKNQTEKETSMLTEEVSRLKTLVNELVAVVNHTNTEMQELKKHAFASRQYVCDLADQLGVTFEKHNKFVSNGKL
jgi:response regulator RpfG family c-di-GMP phosphodiesterase